MIADLRSLACALGGEVSGRQVLAPGPGHSHRDRSISIRIEPNAPDGFIVYSFAGDDPLVCKDYIRERLGLAQWRPGSSPAPTISRPRPRPVPVESDAELERRNAKHLMFARSIWDAAKSAKGTIVERYLVETRKLELPHTDAIRFHPHLKVTYGDHYAPTMVCRLSDIRTSEFTGVHRTFLSSDAQKIGRTSLGRKVGSCIKLDEDVTEGLGIAEGVETAIAARYLYRPVWCVIDAGGMRNFPVLAAIEHLEIFADNDFKKAGELAARECQRRWDLHGAETAIVMPPNVGQDIADVIADRKVYSNDGHL
jgi:putative DNA primase/helicase